MQVLIFIDSDDDSDVRASCVIVKSSESGILDMLTLNQRERENMYDRKVFFMWYSNI